MPNLMSMGSVVSRATSHRQQPLLLTLRSPTLSNLDYTGAPMYRIDCREMDVFLEIGPQGIVGVAPTKPGERVRVRAGTGEFSGQEGKVMNLAGEDAICEIGKDLEMQILPLDSLLLLEEA